MTETSFPDPRLYFPPRPDCYGCVGSGWIAWGPPVPCFCTQHEARECEPDICSPACKQRALLREIEPIEGYPADADLDAILLAERNARGEW